MKHKILLFALSLFTTVTLAAAPAKPKVTLTLAPNKTLPGLAVPLNIRVDNGPRALQIGPAVRVRVTSPDGQSFFADWEGVDNGELELGLTIEDDEVFTLPANASIDLGVPALDLSRPSWALDRRLLSQPGEWRLQVYLYTDDLSEPVAISNTATLTIETPSGRDFRIWEAVQRGEFRGIPESVVAEYADSRYFPYIAGAIARRSTDEKIAIIRRAIESHPSSPAVPSLRYALVSYYEAEAGRVFFETGNFEEAVALAEKGRSEFMLLKNGKDAWGKLKAKAKLDDYPSRAYFAELRRLQQEKGTKKK